MEKDLPQFNSGDIVKVIVKLVEGNRERFLVFEGGAIRHNGGGLRQTFTVRRVSYGIGVERISPAHSPKLESN